MAPSDLEQRRLAIADALRAVMAEPYPTPAFDRDDDGVEERASVPPLTRAEPMSKPASRALFGHH